MNGLPGLRLLPDAPRPGRSHRTHRPRSAQQLQRLDHGDTVGHLAPFIPVTNAIESLNRQIRKIIKTRGSFPSQDSARKLLYLAITRAQRNWRHTYNWSSALTAFRIHFGDRIPDTAI
jgi:transposase-like protein